MSEDTSNSDNEREDGAGASHASDHKALPHESPREVSAMTIARMMGVATATELKILDGKVDLLTAKMANINVRLEKIVSLLSGAPTGADLERVDVQLGALKSAIMEALGKGSEHKSSGAAEPARPRARIISNAPREDETSND